MPHDVTQADLWYHDAIIPTCILGNWLRVLRDHELSEDEKRIILNKSISEVENNRKIIYEEYLEKRRLENGG